MKKDKKEFEGSEELDKFNQPLDRSGSNPYPAKVDFTKEQYSLFDIKRKIEEFQEINLEPEFQRNKGIWPGKKKSRLIESILMGIPLPLFYFAEGADGKLAVVDGLQRISTILDFFHDRFALNNLVYLPRYNRKKFSALPRTDQSNIERFQIQVNVLGHKIDEKIRLDIFERINSGGTPLNKQEMRNAIYMGKSTRLLKELAESDAFKKVMPMQAKSKRMKDRYFILRFLAFYLWRNKQSFCTTDKLKSQQWELVSDFDTFLANYMIILNNFPDSSINELEELFSSAMANAYLLYGETAFKREHKQSHPFNMGVFESISYLLTKCTITQSNTRRIADRIDRIVFSDDFKKNLLHSMTGKKVLEEHFNALDQQFSQFEGE